MSQAGRAGFLEGGGGVSERRRRGSVAEGHHGAGAVVATVAASVTEVASGLDQGRALRLNTCPWRQDGAPWAQASPSPPVLPPPPVLCAASLGVECVLEIPRPRADGRVI